MNTGARQATQHHHGGTIMPAELRLDQCCVVIDCLKPARETGGLCTAHWRGLSPMERALLAWEAEQPTEPIDAQAVCECVGLEAALLLEFTDDRRGMV